MPTLTLLIVAMCLISCSIHEEREPCPRFLEIDISGAEEERLAAAGYTEVKWSLDYLSGCQSGAVALDGVPDTLHLEIPVGEEAFFSACCTFEGAVSPASGLVIPLWEGCPELMTYGALIDLSDREPHRHISLHKDHSVVLIDLHDDYSSGCEYVVRGNVCGYSGQWEPEAGEFAFRLSPGRDGKCRVVVPRQLDASLKLCVYADGTLERTFSLGEFIMDSGHDWAAESLDDISITVDYTHSSVSLTVNQWKKTTVFSIVV